MKFSSFSEQIVTRTFTRGDQSVELQINIDAFTPEYFRQVAKRLQPTNKKLKDFGKDQSKTKTIGKRRKVQSDDDDQVSFEAEARTLEINREIFADYLFPEVLKGWDLVEDDGETPVVLSRKSLLRLPPQLVEELWDFSSVQSQTVKKQPTAGTEESQTTAGTTEGGFSGLRAVGGQST